MPRLAYAQNLSCGLWKGLLKHVIRTFNKEMGLPWWLSWESPPARQETRVQSLGPEDPLGEGNGNPLQYSCLGNPMNRGSWWAIVYGVTRVRRDLVTKPPTKKYVE